MTRPIRSDEILEADLQEYLDSRSDFAFEMRVLKHLKDMRFSCAHGGPYTDAVTGKTREFDIRAKYRRGDDFRPNADFTFALAVECKNLSVSFPILMSCVPRAYDEAFHDVIASFHPSTWSIEPCDPARRVRSTVITLDSRHTMWRMGDSVGKECVQVGRAAAKDAEIVTLGPELYDKWTQALMSASDVVAELATQQIESRSLIRYSVLLPIVVVPDNCLWAVIYDESGNLVRSPRRVDHLCYSVRYKYKLEPPAVTPYVASHVDFVTFTGLQEHVEFITNGDAVDGFFRQNVLEERLQWARDGAAEQ